MLVLYGDSGVGKTYFHNILFNDSLFKQSKLDIVRSNFSDDNVYHHETVLWIHSDLND